MRCGRVRGNGGGLAGRPGLRFGGGGRRLGAFLRGVGAGLGLGRESPAMPVHHGGGIVPWTMTSGKGSSGGGGGGGFPGVTGGGGGGGGGGRGFGPVGAL